MSDENQDSRAQNQDRVRQDVLRVLVVVICVALLIHLGRTWYYSSFWAAKQSSISALIGLIIGLLVGGLGAWNVLYRPEFKDETEGD